MSTIPSDFFNGLLREIYGFLLSKGIINSTEWSEEIEARIKAAAERIAKAGDSN